MTQIQTNTRIRPGTRIADSDGYSDGSTNTSSCIRPIGFKVASELTATSGDCDDNDQNQNPGAPEVCNGEDDDCDGETDEVSVHSQQST